MSPIPPMRRLMILWAGCSASVLLFHGWVAVALITRGDGFLERGRAAGALVYYRRALWFDGSSITAADRFAFAAMLARRPADLVDGIAVASRALRRDPENEAILLDRALLLQLRHQEAAASSDFARAARVHNDARLYHFAAWAAYHANEPQRAAVLWRAALAANRAFTPARLALVRAGAQR